MKEEFYNKSFEKLKDAITNIDKKNVDDIYALSFWFSNEGDELHFPVIMLSYNTKYLDKNNLTFKNHLFLISFVKKINRSPAMLDFFF